MIQASMAQGPALPVGVPVAALEASVAPRASSSENHVRGAVAGSVATYDATEAFSWYVAAALGMVTLNRGRRGLTRTARGVEDTTDRRGR